MLLHTWVKIFTVHWQDDGQAVKSTTRN